RGGHAGRAAAGAIGNRVGYGRGGERGAGPRPLPHGSRGAARAPPLIPASPGRIAGAAAPPAPPLPIGGHDMPLSASERERLIQRYADGPARLESALGGVPAAAVQGRPAPRGWSAHAVARRCAR